MTHGPGLYIHLMMAKRSLELSVIMCSLHQRQDNTEQQDLVHFVVFKDYAALGLLHTSKRIEGQL